MQLEPLRPVVQESDKLPEWDADEYWEIEHEADMEDLLAYAAKRENAQDLEEQRKAMEEDRADANMLLSGLKIATENGLQYEFLDGVFNYLRSGDSVATAVNCALYDWDM